jgi:hypothetical protein
MPAANSSHLDERVNILIQVRCRQWRAYPQTPRISFRQATVSQPSSQGYNDRAPFIVQAIVDLTKMSQMTSVKFNPVCIKLGN